MIRITRDRHIHLAPGILWKSPKTKPDCARLAAVAALITVLVAVLLALTGCGGSDSASRGAIVNVSYSKKLKTRILVNAQGRTLYLWGQESAGKPICYDDATYHCSRAWPPLRSAKTPAAGSGVDRSMLKTVRRTDGDPQVTYHGHPLYTDAGSAANGLKGDRKAGDVNGQGFYYWYAVSPSGDPVK